MKSSLWRRAWLWLLGPLYNQKTPLDADSAQPADDIGPWRERILHALFLSAAVFGLVAYWPTLQTALETGTWPAIVLFGILYLMILAVVCLRRLPYKWRAVLGMAVLWAAGLSSLELTGMYGSGRIWFFFTAMMTTVLLGFRAGLWALAANLATMFVYLFYGENLEPVWRSLVDRAGHAHSWMVVSATFLMLSTAAVISLSYLVRGLHYGLFRSRVLRERLDEEKRRLELSNQELIREMRERRQAQEALELSEERFRIAFQAIPHAMAITRLEDGMVVDVNEGFVQMSGFNRDEVVGRRIDELMIWNDWKARERLLGLLAARGDVENYEADFRLKDGSTGRGIMFVRVIGLNGSPHALSLTRDLGKLVEAERALRKSEEKYKEILEGIQEGYYEVDTQGVLTFCNTAMGRILGCSREEIIGQRIVRFMDGETTRRLEETGEEAERGGQPNKTLEWSLVRADGTRCHIAPSVYPRWDESGVLLGFRGMARDITRQRELEAKLRQAQKMEAVGTLAGGIAHDFNNILGSIIGFTELATENIQEGRDAAGELRRVVEASLRARELIKQILTFSRQSESGRRAVDAREVVEEALGLIRASLPSTIGFSYQNRAWRGVVMADPSQIHQVVINLCTNAAQAMGQGGGSLAVRLEEVVVEVDDATSLASPGSHLCLTVSDTGPGMEPAVIDRVFDPFFTTKSQGEGTGMGLAVVHGIVTDLGGAVEVESAPGQGATFRVLLPLVPGKTAAQPGQGEGAPEPSGGVILYVDDESTLVEVASTYLESLGYKVVVCRDGLEALETFRRDPMRFDLVVTDQTMPRLTGAQLAREVMAIRPGMPLVMTTGYSDELSWEAARALGAREFLPKPFLRQELARAVARALASREGQAEGRAGDGLI